MATRLIARTMCPMNCHPTLCGMIVEVEGDRLVEVRGDPDNPDSRGFLCVRGQASREIIGNPKRVVTPMVRARRGQDGWREAGWDEALDLIASRMTAVGREAVGLWAGHGLFANNYGTRVGSHLLRRFANFYGCQWWSPTIICWGLGAFGLGLTGPLEANTKEDMGAHAELILLWGANLASQPNTGRHLAAARRRGAHVVTIDVRDTEAAAQSDEVLKLHPGTDAALALGLMHVIIGEGRHDREFVARHTVGFDALAAHVRQYSPEWAGRVTGLAPERIVALARRYATTRPAMILLGGSSMHKGVHGWQGGRAIGCLPALTGNLAIPGGGFGPRHGAASHGQGLTDIVARERRPPGRYVPNQMSRITEALVAGQVRAMLLFGTDMLSSFADAGRVAEGLAGADLVVSHDLFMNDTARQLADVFLPSTSWLEELGCKSTNTHLYLMDKVLEPPGEARPLPFILKGLAARLGLPRDFYPWESDEGPLDAILDHPATGHATVAVASRRGRDPCPRHLARGAPGSRLSTRLRGRSSSTRSAAAAAGLPPLPVHDASPSSAAPAIVPAGTHAHPFSRLLRPRPGAADPRPTRPRARALDLARRCRRARPCRRRGDPRLQRSRGVPGPRAGHRADARRNRVDARWVGRAEPGDRRRPVHPRRGRGPVRLQRRSGGLRRDG